MALYFHMGYEFFTSIQYGYFNALLSPGILS